MFSVGDSTPSVTARYLLEENTILKVHIALDWVTLSLGEIAELVPNEMAYFWRRWQMIQSFLIWREGADSEWPAYLLWLY